MRTIIISALAFCLSFAAASAQPKTINIGTDKTDLVLQVAEDGRLYQTYFGEKLLDADDLATIPMKKVRAGNGTFNTRAREVCSCSGNEDYFSPALGMVHTDGNRSTYLYFQSMSETSVPGGRRTDITLRDKVYPVEVVLHYEVYPKENVIVSWSDVCHHEKGVVRLMEQNSPLVFLEAGRYYLTEFSGDWASEARMSTQELRFGKKIVDTKLGSRANIFCSPFFELGLDAPAKEQGGTVLMGTIAWVGNWRYTLEIDNHNLLCVSAGLNPTASDYELESGEVFSTPEFIFTLSQNGTGEASRNIHDWARQYRVKNGMGGRLSLLNNWENTYFSFDEPKLAACMEEAAKLGVDLFLLDDGWFGNGSDARNNDTAGLGDWEVNHAKLPAGVPGLVKAAEKAGVGFGIWIEPEMVNPQSQLYRKHPDWVIHQQDRELYTYRNQLVLDLANPKVQDYVFSIVDDLMKENPDIKFFKWDCNSPITNIYSPYEKKRQSNLYVDHARGVTEVMRRVAEKYPDVPIMLCSGGGGRCDYSSLRYFTEFWCSDNTDPVNRLYIQWSFSQFFPSKTMCAHVTSWNSAASVKFRTDVASMCKLGFDIGFKDMSDAEFQYCRTAVQNWKRLSPAIMDGDQYRLVSPYESSHMAVNYVSKDKGSAVLFTYDIHPIYSEPRLNVKLQGLDPRAHYRVEEINLMPGAKSNLPGNGKVYSGDYLMKVGLDALTGKQMNSRVIELVRQ